MAATLTENRINKLVAARRAVEVCDGGSAGEPGLRLRVFASGAATWSYSYRRKADGKKQRVTLGTYTNRESVKATRRSLSLGEARAEALKLRSTVADGQDPIEAARAKAEAQEAERRAKAAEMTVADMLASFLASRKHLRSVDAYRALFRVDVTAPKDEPHPLGYMKLSQVKLADISRTIDRAVRRGSEITANRLLTRLHTAFDFAKSKGWIASNPCADAKRVKKEKPRERTLDAAELRAFLATLPLSGLHIDHQRILMIQLLTGQRVGEVSGMCKREIDLTEYLWSLPAQRTKTGRAHVVPLPNKVRGIIMEAIQASDHPEFVFPARKGGHVTQNVVSHALARVQPAFGFEDGVTGKPAPFTSHDLRRSVATHLDRLGVSERVIGKLLNHKEVEDRSVTTSVYMKGELLAERFEALVKWQRALDAIRAGADPFGFSVNNLRDIEARYLAAPALQIEARHD